MRNCAWMFVPLCAVLVGCPKPPALPPTATSTSTTSAGAEEPTATSDQDQCARMMLSLQQIFDLQELDIKTNIEDGLQDLNRWASDCAKEPPLKLAVPESLKSAVAPDMQAAIDAPRFTREDGEHLRTCLVTVAQAKYAAGKAEMPRDQAVAVFEYVVRTIALTEDDLPYTPHEVCLTSRGTALDRAWLFAGILRQMRIDTVRLTPAEADAREPGLIAVLVRDENQPNVYLFDPLGGVAIRTEATHSAPPATLTQVLEMPDLLKPVSGEWTAETLKAAKVELIGSLALYSPRMAQLQPHFTGERALVVFDPLVDTEIGPGYVSRVLAGSNGLWTAAALRLWTHEDGVVARRKGLGKEPSEPIVRRLEVLQTPIKPEVASDGTVITDPTTNLARFEPAEREHWKARLLQLQGSFADAIRRFTLVRTAQVELNRKSHWPLTPEMRELHRRAGDEAQFFAAVCQFEQGKHEEAILWFKKTAQAEDSPWKAPALRYLALCQAAQDKKDEAVKTLQKLPENDPQAAWTRTRIAAWQASDTNDK